MVLPLYAMTLFVSAFLLFLVQPMIGKMILPRLGGTPQVWNTCMVFFQSVLLAGYAYTHTVSTRLSLRRQLTLHGILLLIPLLVLLPWPFDGPFNISGFEPPAGGNPVFYTLYFLALVVGLPFFVVSTSAPLLQRWFGYTEHPTAKDPYYLYGASNLGSMLALLCYPFVVEPHLLLGEQAGTWTAGYILLIVLVAGCALIVWQTPPSVKLAAEVDLPPLEIPVPPPVDPRTAVKSGPPPAARSTGRKKDKIQVRQAQKTVPSRPAPAPVQPRPDVMTPWRRLRWVLLAAAPSSLMLGSITYISTDLSPIPLFWVLPLALYLSTFILVFLRYPVPWTGFPQNIMLAIHPFAVLALCLIIVGAFTVANNGVKFTTSITLLAFFFTTMVCHGELARDRPSTKHLTEFFLWMSVGGMLGGMFNGLAAPLLFTGVAEYPLALVVACLMRPQQSSQGGSDTFIADTFPGLINRLGNVGKNLETVGVRNFLLLIVLGTGIAGGCIYLLIDSMEVSAFLGAVLYGVGLVVVVSVLALRFKPEHALSSILDGLLPLLVFCLAAFLLANAFEGLGWIHPVRKLFHNMGYEPSTTGLYFMVGLGIPLFIGLFFSTRPLRYGLAIGAVLMANHLRTERDERSVFADRSYFGILRVHESDLQKQSSERDQLTPDEIRQLEPTKDDLKRMAVDPEDEVYFPPYTYLMHGTTHHGLNYQVPSKLRRLATTYYHRKGPVGMVMEKLNWFKGPLNSYDADSRLAASFAALGGATMGAGNLPAAPIVSAWSEPPYATVGLGTGTMASYGRPFQHVVFYEIDNTIRSFHLEPYSHASRSLFGFLPDAPFFNYLHDAKNRGCNVEVIMGDARLSMKQERRQPGQVMNPKRDNYYRVIELDAFSSDAIPVHLITEEAISMYRDKLTEQGVLCVHTSNRHVDLVKPVVDIAKKLNLAYRVGIDRGRYDKRAGEFVLISGYRGHFGSEYVMLARKDSYLPPEGPVVSPLTGEEYMTWSTPDPAGNKVWTDDFSNLAGMLRESFAVTLLLLLFLGIGLGVTLIFLISKSMQR